MFPNISTITTPHDISTLSITMSDIRSLLRNERDSRRLTHPHASYTASGKLLCSLCSVPIKTESLWDSHTRSQQHVARVKALKSAPPPVEKRKRSEEEDEDREEVKRTKGAPEGFVPQGFFDEQDDGQEARVEKDGAAGADGVTAQAQDSTPAQAAVQVNEDEWAAFERDLAAPAPAADPVPHAGATISAAPMTAEEIAAQAREEQSQQRGRREVEAEEEREDATRALEEEFEQMESLEERVRRLREQRERLRMGSTTGAPAEMAEPVNGGGKMEVVEEAAEDDEDDDDEEEDFDDWQFGAR